MAANIYIRSFPLGTGWSKLASVSTVVDATLIASSQNTNAVSVRVNGGTSMSWPPGGAVRLEGVDLSEIEVSGDALHEFLVVGNTR